jgi:hypothetical protein
MAIKQNLGDLYHIINKANVMQVTKFETRQTPATLRQELWGGLLT